MGQLTQYGSLTSDALLLLTRHTVQVNRVPGDLHITVRGSVVREGHPVGVCVRGIVWDVWAVCGIVRWLTSCPVSVSYAR